MPGSTVYNIPIVMRIQVLLNVLALEQSLNEIMGRHEILRTRFMMVDGKPMQAVVPSAVVSLSITDLQDRPAEVREPEAQHLMAMEIQRPFNLATGPLFRAVLLRLSDTDHILTLLMHHIISDGWSVGILGQELAKLYQAFVYGRPSPLPELPIQYGDFASWQRGWLQGEVLEAQLGYWRKQLAGAPPLLELATDHPRLAMPSFRGASQSFVLLPPTLKALKNLAREGSATLFMVLLAAFCTLLYRYSNQEDIVVGSPIANRNHIEVEGLIGFFTNTLVLRVRISTKSTFRQLLRQIREVTLGAYAHQDLPFEKLVEELQPARELGHNPLFQVMFTLQNAQTTDAAAASTLAPEKAARSMPDAPAAGGSQPGAVAHITPPVRGSAKFDITLSMTETPQGVASSWEYNTDLFDDSTITQMIRHFGAVLDGVIADPECALSRLPLLSPQERHHLLKERNPPATNRTPASLLHQMFEDQVERTPDRVALVADGNEFTYSALNAACNRLAQRLRGRGVGPEILVSICLERSPQLVIAILAVLKAGGAYVPLDPSYPQGRLADMIENAQARLLITNEQLRRNFARLPLEILYIDDETADRGEPDPPNPHSTAVSENACYVIYTSGSTGRPKGVVVPHRAAVNHMAWMRERWSFGADNVVLHKTSASFDASVWEIFVPLIAGARLVIARPDGHRDPAFLVQTMLRERVTDVQFVPSMLELLLLQPDLARCLRLRRMFLGGEALPRSLIERFMKRNPAEVVNLYGPTEVTIQSTAKTAARGLSAGGITEPIGRPISNIQAYVLDENLEPVPVGVPGQLYLGGVGVARGYVACPGLTAERFIPDPFAGKEGSRLYATGDRVRHLADGDLEFLGRIDNQVKLRGFRIELGEIESILTRHPDVRAAAVIVREDTPDDKRITAYAVPRGQPEISEDIRPFLREYLPEYMMPAAIISLTALPLLPNGKLDPSALPAPTGERAALEQSYMAPSTPLEQLLAQIWIEVLGVERVGVADSFFELGGHSLLATQVLTRLRGVLDIDLPLRQFFEAPTVAGLAAAILRPSEDRRRIEKTAELIVNVSNMSDEDVEVMLRDGPHCQEGETA